MSTRIYIMPVTGSGFTIGDPPQPDPRRPKYADALLAGLSWTGMDFGFEPVMLVAVRDIPTATHNALAANSDVVAVPANLGATIGSSLAQVQAALETFNIPAGWVTAGMTYGQVLRIIAASFQFFQRFHAIHGNVRVFGSGVTLATTFGALPAAVRTSLQATADSLGYSTAGITAASTLRQIIKSVADQWATGKALRMGEVSL